MQSIPITLNLADGSKIVTEYEWPEDGFELTFPEGKATTPETAALAVLGHIADTVLAEVRPLLPPAGPGRKVVTKRTPEGQIDEVAEYPPTPDPDMALAHYRSHIVSQLSATLLRPLAEGVRTSLAA